MVLVLSHLDILHTTPSLMSGRSPAPLRYATKKVRMISELLIMVQDSIYRQPGLTSHSAGPGKRVGVAGALKRITELCYNQGSSSGG